MDNELPHTTDVEANELPTSDQWTDAELAAYQQLEVDLFARYSDMALAVRHFFCKRSKFMAELFLTPTVKKNTTTS